LIMPSGSYLLDTNIVIAMFKGDASTKKHLEQAEQVFLSVTSLGELYYGALHSMQVEKNMAKLRELSSILTVCKRQISPTLFARWGLFDAYESPAGNL